MTDFTTHEQQEIDRANNSGLQPVVFVHGLWLLASSWDRWRALFEEQGYTTLAPGWPDDPETVAQATDDPEVFAHPWTEDRVNTKNPRVVPFCSSRARKTIRSPLAVVSAEYKLQQQNPAVTEFHEMPHRGHTLTIDHGWREVAETALAFIAKQLKSR